MSPLIVGIGHKARHGKDSLAKFLVHQIHKKSVAPIDVRRYSFATALKCYCRVSGWMTVKDGPVLQFVGTELFREKVDADFWVKMVDFQIQEEQPDIAVFSDMRFPNEKAFCERFGFSVKIERLNLDGSLYAVNDGRSTTHKSETALEGHKFTYDFQVQTGNMQAIENAAEWLVDVAIATRRK